MELDGAGWSYLIKRQHLSRHLSTIIQRHSHAIVDLPPVNHHSQINITIIRYSRGFAKSHQQLSFFIFDPVKKTYHLALRFGSHDADFPFHNLV